MVQQITEKSEQKVRNAIYRATFRDTAYKVYLAIILLLPTFSLARKPTKLAACANGMCECASVDFTYLAFDLWPFKRPTFICPIVSECITTMEGERHH